MKEKKKRPLSKQITISVPFKIITGIVVVMAIIIGSVVMRVTNYAEESIESQMQLIAEVNADHVLSYMNISASNAQAMSYEIHRTQVDFIKNYRDGDDTTQLRRLMESYMSDSKIFSTYIATYPTTANPDGLSFYVYRQQAGSSSTYFDIYHDYDSYGQADYFLPAVTTNQIHVTEPYEYELSSGEIVYLITVSQPFFDSSGKIMGVANCDFLSTAIEELDYENGGYKTAITGVLTDNMMYVANSKYPDYVGSTDEQASSEVVNAVQNEQQVETLTDGMYIIYSPITMNGSDLVWTSMYQVKESDVMSTRNAILRTIILVAVIGVIALAIVGIYFFKKALSPITYIVGYADELSNGNLNVDMSYNADNEFGDIIDALRGMSETWKLYIGEISRVLGAISNKDLTEEIEAEFIGDFAPIKVSLETIVTSLNDTLNTIGRAATLVSEGANQISQGAQNLSQGSTEQAASVEELSATVNDIYTQTQTNSENAQVAAEKVNAAGNEIENSNRQMTQLMAAMEDMTNKSNEIQKIVKTIEDIAFQTNILALNAAVEAARAGAAGKGFAVVADEVRNLATKSSEAAGETTRLIEETINAINHGNALAESTSKALNTVVVTTKEAVDVVNEISLASETQATAVSQITEGINQVSVVVQTNAATAEESAASSEELYSQANILEAELNEFNLK